MNRLFTVAWLALAAAAGVAEFLAIDGMWVPILFIGLAVEMLAVFRKAKGDTLSEHIWAFLRDARARIPLVLGITVWMGARVYGAGIDTPALIDEFIIGRAALALGMVGWLVVHFLTEGKYG